jgi:hypothetical protein
MKKLIAATTLSVMMAAGGAFAQSTYSTGTAGSAGSEGERMTTPAPVMDDSSTSMDVGVDTTTTGSINTNSNCTPPNGGNPINMSAEQQAPVVQSCNPR